MSGAARENMDFKARFHLMVFHIYSYSMVSTPITGLQDLFFSLTAGAAKWSCIHPASQLITNNKDPSLGVELTVVLRTVIAGAGTKSENTLLFGVNHCTDITLLVPRLLKRCSVVKLLNVSVRELAFEVYRSGANRGEGRRETKWRSSDFCIPMVPGKLGP